MEIMKYEYSTQCDTWRCMNIAELSIGERGESPGTFLNVCCKCLKDIVDKGLPIIYGSIENHPEVQKILKILSDKSAVLQQELDEARQENQKITGELEQAKTDLANTQRVLKMRMTEISNLKTKAPE